MNVSVIIPSYNPTLRLADTINSLRPQAKHIHQLVIVIDNEKYGKFAGTIENKYKSGFNILNIHVQKNAGRAVARNTGVKLSEGELLLFLDDDAIAEGNLVEGHCRYHLQKPDSIIVGNGYRNPHDVKDNFSKYITSVELSWHTGKDKIERMDYDNFIFTAANMSVSKSTFMRLKGFDERLKDAEDFDFGLRALNEKINIVYDRNLTAWHNDWPGIEKYIQRHNEYTRAKAGLAKMHPEYLQHFPGLVSSKTSAFKKIILAVFRNTICRGVIGNSPVFRVLPLKLKFIMYRLTISANSGVNKW